MFADDLLHRIALRHFSVLRHTPEDKEEVIVHIRFALMPLVQSAELLERPP